MIGKRSRAVRSSRQQVFDHAGVAPTEQAVEITKLLVKLVVARRTNRNHIRCVARDAPNFFRQRMNPPVRADSFAILHAEVEELAGARPIDEYSRNHQRPEEIALATFIHTEMRLEHFRGMHFLIANPSFAENFGLECELHEILNPTPLQQDFWPFFVNGHT